jgi:hypothetical protein
MNMNELDKKETTLVEQFNSEQKAALAIEEQIKQLQTKYQEHIVNMTRLQGAFQLLKELKEPPVTPAT